jgi:hypothetical protein
MAGITALLDQEIGTPQGNLNPELYSMATATPSAFHDVTVASSGTGTCDLNTASMCNNSIPLSSGSGAQAGFQVGTGYDEVTGLGSLDVGAFLGNSSASKTTPTVTVTPNPASITTAQSLSVQVTVGGSPSPTGSVILTSGSFVSAATPLTAGIATISISASTLAAGTDTLTAAYTPDASSSSLYNSASGSNTVVVTAVPKITPTVNVSLSSSSITTAQQLTVTVAVNGGTGNQTPTGTVTLAATGYSSSPMTLSSGGATIIVAAGSLPAGVDALTITYAPDSASANIYATSNGAYSVTVTAAPPPTFTIAGTAVTIASPGASGASTITITPLNGFTGGVALTAIVTSPSGAQYPPTWSFGTNPVSVTYPSLGTATLTVSTTAATSASLAYPLRPASPWYAGGGAALACILLVCVPARRRKWRNLLGMVALLFALAGGAIACGGGSKSGGGGTGTSGTTAGSYTITVTGTSTSGSMTAPATIVLTVQ